MDEPDLQKIAEKIRRLLALSKSPNIHEAAAATAKAQELMFKYNLDLYQIPDKQKEDYIRDDYTVGEGRAVAWARQLLFPIAEYNFCKAFYTHDVDSRGRLHRVPFMVIVGEPHNVEMVKYIHAFARDEIIRLAEKEWDINGFGNKATWKKNFCYGAVQGFSEKLREQWLANQQASVKSRELIVVKDKDLWEAVQKLGGRIKQMNLAGSASGVAYRNGREKGRQINVKTPINSGQNNPGGFIQ